EPDMRLPIQYALLWDRAPSPAARLDWSRVRALRFEGAPDERRYPCLAAVLDIARSGDLAAMIGLSAADEVAVARFLRGEVRFDEIASYLRRGAALGSAQRAPASPDLGALLILGQDDFTIHQAGEGDPGSFTSKPWWAQAIVLAAGVTMNMVLALVVLTIAFATGTTASTGDVRVRSVAADSPAQKAGIQVGDIVRSIDGRQITRATDLVNYVTSQAKLHPDREVTLEIERNGRPLAPITAVPRAEPPEGEGPLGIGLEEVQGAKTYALPDAFRQAVPLP